MNAKPIIFSAPMVRALLSGTKTQTRRVVKPQPSWQDMNFGGVLLGFKQRSGKGHWIYPNALAEIVGECPYGQSGSLLWVRETWAEHDDEYGTPLIVYKAGGANIIGNEGTRHDPEYVTFGGKAGDYGPPERWRSPIHMPRWASRITLRITDVRVQRVQDISEEDARAEGAEAIHWGESYWIPECFLATGGFPIRAHHYGFQRQWDSINGPGSWDANPWVWALSFEVLQQNVDAVAA